MGDGPLENSHLVKVVADSLWMDDEPGSYLDVQAMAGEMEGLCAMGDGFVGTHYAVREDLHVKDDVLVLVGPADEDFAD